MLQLNRIVLFIIICMVMDSFQAVVWGQTITGKVVDSMQQPVDGATIVLQALDSTASSLSNQTNGRKRKRGGHYRAGA